MRAYSWRSFSAGAVVALAACFNAPSAGSADDGPLSPIVVSPVPQQSIVPVKGSDGRYHLLYELQLTNTLDANADLRIVEVLDARSGKTLLALDADAIVKGEYLHTLNRKTAPDTVFRPFESRVLILNLAFDARDDTPRALDHRFEITGADPFTTKPGTFTYKGGAVTISDATPPVLQAPLEGKGWLAASGCCGPTGHINALIGLNGQIQGSERFAIDWIKIDEDGRFFTGDKVKPESWAGYGAKALAVADGVVTASRDDQQNQIAGTMPSGMAFAEQLGNYVGLALPGGLTAFYAHLVPGSVKVKAGDRVKAGDVLGLLGNTGGSLAPHLHFHIVNGPEVVTSDGYPYVLRSFGLAGQAQEEGFAAALDGKPGFPRRDAMKPEARENELPLDFAIVDFPEGE